LEQAIRDSRTGEHWKLSNKKYVRRKIVFAILGAAAVLGASIAIYWAVNRSRDEVQTYEVDVPAFHIWHHTFIECEPGDVLVLKAQGQWYVGSKPEVQASEARSSGPEGQADQIAEAGNWALLNAPLGALVGRIGSRKFLVGKSCRVKLEKTEKGELRLCANDILPGGDVENQFKQNSGVVHVRIKLRRAKRGR
jgi:hypothetical protein